MTAADAEGGQVQTAGRDRFPGGRLNLSRRTLLRTAAVAALLVLAALGTHAREVTPVSTAGMLAAAAGPATVIVGVVIVTTTCLLLAAVLVWLGMVSRRRPDHEQAVVWQRLEQRWARAVALLVAFALIALPIAALVVALHGRRGRRPAVRPTPVFPVVPHAHGPGAPPGVPGAAWIAFTTAGVLVAVAVTGLLLLRRRRVQAAPPRDRMPSPLAAAVAAGSSALRAPVGAREAIIACYAAMEEALAAAGAPRRVADTPEELLNRAVATGVIRTGAARRLTELFREARFSPHEFARVQRNAAQAALDDIGNELAGAR